MDIIQGQKFGKSEAQRQMIKEQITSMKNGDAIAIFKRNEPFPTVIKKNIPVKQIKGNPQ